jgi:GntR family transcriptional regulator, trigonelline degradation regulator
VNGRPLEISRQAAPVRTQTLQKLREAILDNYFMPGERLYEKTLCERLGVSRTSIREALRQLEAEGLVSTIPNQGPIVTRVTLKEAEEIYQVREVLECLAVRLFAERATEEQVRELARTVDDLEKSYSAHDVRALLNVKTTMYDIIFSGSGNSVAQSIFRSLVARVNFLRRTSLSQPGRPSESVSEIKAILRAIQDRDPQGASDKCLEHIRRASAMALEGLRREESSARGADRKEEQHEK